jgi:hypothetical protein
MRVIVNLPSNRAAKAAGWRAQAVQLNGKNEADLEEVLKAVSLEDGSSMYDLIIKDGNIMEDIILFVNGTLMPGPLGLKTNVKDNVQIHIMDKPSI